MKNKKGWFAGIKKFFRDMRDTYGLPDYGPGPSFEIDEAYEKICQEHFSYHRGRKSAIQLEKETYGDHLIRDHYIEVCWREFPGLSLSERMRIAHEVCNRLYLRSVGWYDG